MQRVTWRKFLGYYFSVVGLSAVSLMECGPMCLSQVLAADSAKEAATVDEAVKVLDLRTLALPEGAIPSEIRQVGSVNYEIKSDPKKAFQGQQQQFLKLGWKELPGTMAEAAFGSGQFQKSNYVVAVTTSDAGRPDKPGMSRVAITNFGNLRLSKFPLIKGAKSLFVNEATAMYETEVKLADAVESTRKLFLDAGWEPYGSVGGAPNATMMTFKRNAIQIHANVNIAPALAGKTSITYSALLLSADIPAPPTALDVRYVDLQKTLRFATKDSFNDVATFYQLALGKRGWKPTTEKLVTNLDRFNSPIGFQVFRNDAREMLSLDLQMQDDTTQVVVAHLTAGEQAILDQKAKEAQKKQLAEKEARKKAEPMPKSDGPDVDALIKKAIGDAPKTKTDKVGIPIPQKAKKVDQASDNVLQIKLAAGTGQAAAVFMRDQLIAGKWSLDDDADIDENSCDFTFKKGTQQITLTFVDTGLSDVTMMVIGIGAKLEPAKADPNAKVAGTEAKSMKKPAIPTDDDPMPEPKKKDKPKQGIAKMKKLPNEGTLTMGEKTYKLTNVVAYTVKSRNAELTTVLLTEKPIDLDTLKASLAKNGTDDGLFEIQPKVRLSIDEGDKLQFMSLWADASSVTSNSNLEGDVLIEDGRARGTARLSKVGEFSKKTYTFVVSFDSQILAIPAPKE